MNHNEQLNRGQSDAVMHTDGPCVVIAPPGSGKTRVLTLRIGALIRNHGVLPQNILVVTFTRAAASQMRERYLQCCGEADTGVTFGTFHAIFYRMIKESIQMGAMLNGAQTDRTLRILSEKEKRHILAAIVNQSDERRAKFQDMEQLCAYISRRKNRREAGRTQECEPERTGSEAIEEAVWHEYTEACRELGVLDFEDIADCRRRILQDERNAQLLAYWRRKYRYILVDEFQDISPIQFEILRMLAAPQNHFFVVGDDDQAIYGFRGSDTKLMLELPKYYPEIRICRLNVNYRSGQKIVAAAKHLIAQNRLRYDKEIMAIKAESGSVKLLVCSEQKDQMRMLVKKLQQIPENETAAVILRTNALAAQMQRMIVQQGLPAAGINMKNEGNLYDQPVSKDILAYLKLALGGVSAQDKIAAMLRIINKPYRGVSRQAVIQSGGNIEILCRFYADHAPTAKVLGIFREQLTVLAGLPPFAAVTYICSGIGYRKELFSKTTGMDQAEKEQAVLTALEREAGERSSLEEWLSAALEGQVTAASGTDIQGTSSHEKDEAKKPHIRILTMHACKGLEFDHVMLPYLNEGVIPHKRAFLPEETEEERRLLYVAMTRAKKTLLMTCIHRQGDEKYQMSRFLRELF